MHVCMYVCMISISLPHKWFVIITNQSEEGKYTVYTNNSSAWKELRSKYINGLLKKLEKREQECFYISFCNWNDAILSGNGAI